MHEIVFEAKAIRKTFGGVVALRDGNLQIRRGQICGLLGANGSGKTTLSKTICGIHQPTAGELFMHGESVVVRSPIDALQRGIAMVHQHLSLVPELTVWQNICLGHEVLTRAGFLKNKDAKKLASETLGRLEEGIDLDRRIVGLSPAQRQLVEVAKVLTQEPQILILDEPTAALEQEEVESLFAVMGELRDAGVSIVFTSHRMWEVMDICDYVTVFRNGEFVGSLDFAVDGKDEKRIVELITGQPEEATGVAAAPSPSPPSPGVAVSAPSPATSPGPAMSAAAGDEPLLVLDRVLLPSYAKRGGEGVSLSIRPGEIVGISGLQGQGQEELLLLLAGFYRSAGGSMKLEGTAYAPAHPRAAIGRGVVLVPGDRNEEGLFVQHDVDFNINFPFTVNRSRGPVVGRRDTRNRSGRIIERLSLSPPDPAKVVRYLSGGNQQKIVIGKWLDLEPALLLLSDPAKGVDVQAKQELYMTVVELARRGTAVLVYASDNKELISVCSRIVVMFEGSCVEELEGDRISDKGLTAHSLRARYLAEEKV